MYWTAHTPAGDATLCERCALLALNMAAHDFVRRPFDTMVDGLAYINAKCIEGGLPTIPLDVSEYGVCGHCGEDELEPVSA